MQKVKKLVVVLFFIIFFILLGLFLIGYFSPKSAGLNVYANLESSVYINGELVGKTPFQKTLPAKEVVLKVAPSSSQSVFETKLSLTPGVETVVRRDFEESSLTSAGETVSFEKSLNKESSLAVVSVPDQAQITVDGQIQGFAPRRLDTLLAADHQILISSPGYIDRSFTVRTYPGYNLTAVVELARAKEFLQPSQQPIKKVQILSTPNGFLRVRENPSTASAELAQVQPGMSFNFQEEVDDWVKIEYGEGLFGWISSFYTEIVETSN